MNAISNVTTGPILQLPLLLDGSVMLMSKVRLIWSCHLRYTQAYSNKSDFKCLLVGRVINFLWGSKMIVRLMSKAILVVRRLIDCLHQREKLILAHRHWRLSLIWSGPDASTLPLRIKQLAHATFALLVESFKLGMCYGDFFEAFAFDAESMKDAVSMSLVNISMISKEWEGVRASVINFLEENQLLADPLGDYFETNILSDLGRAITEVINSIESTSKKIAGTPT